jgi:hypothetical protein
MLTKRLFRVSAWKLSPDRDHSDRGIENSTRPERRSHAAQVVPRIYLRPNRPHRRDHDNARSSRGWRKPLHRPLRAAGRQEEVMGADRFSGLRCWPSRRPQSGSTRPAVGGRAALHPGCIVFRLPHTEQRGAKKSASEPACSWMEWPQSTPAPMRRWQHSTVA